VRWVRSRTLRRHPATSEAVVGSDANAASTLSLASARWRRSFRGLRSDSGSILRSRVGSTATGVGRPYRDRGLRRDLDLVGPPRSDCGSLAFAATLLTFARHRVGLQGSIASRSPKFACLSIGGVPLGLGATFQAPAIARDRPSPICLSWNSSSWCAHPPACPPSVHSPMASPPPFGPEVPPSESRSVLVVSHHLDGFLRSAAPGLLHPGTGLGSRRFPTSHPRDPSQSRDPSEPGRSPQRLSHPSKNSPHPQPYRVTAAVALLPLPRMGRRAADAARLSNRFPN
jgi:hypothetical protein